MAEKTIETAASADPTSNAEGLVAVVASNSFVPLVPLYGQNFRFAPLHMKRILEGFSDFQELKTGWNGLRVRPCRSLRSSQAWKQSRRTLERKTPRQLHGLSFVLQAWKMSLLGTWSIMVNSNFCDFMIFEAEFPVIF
jgi:hypothetical protein